jgi:hypothetical protein
MAAAHRGQVRRISEEMRYVLDRLIAAPGEPGLLRAELQAEAAWWRSAGDESLLAAVRRSFRTRQLCLRGAASDGTWRGSLSYIGDTDPADGAVCTYDYDRTEIKVPATSPLAQPYGWAAGAGLDVATWHGRTGMSMISAWFLTLARVAAHQQRDHVVVANRVYYETKVLFDTIRPAHVEVRVQGDGDDLLAAIAAADAPVIVLLDSSRPGGDARAVRRVLRGADPARVVCVAWDNTCAPATESPFGPGLSAADLPVPLVVLRSHLKLDQLGLEFSSLGTLVLMSPPAGDGGRRWATDFTGFLPDLLGALGGWAPPASVRLLTCLGLPNPALATRASRHLRAANLLGGSVLAAELTPSGRYWVEENEHQYFVEIHIPELPAAISDFAGSALDQEMTRVEELAAQQSLPVWKSASFGFHYTAIAWHGSEPETAAAGPADPAAARVSDTDVNSPYEPHTVLRIAFGGHEPAVTVEVAELISRYLLERPR